AESDEVFLRRAGRAAAWRARYAAEPVELALGERLGFVSCRVDAAVCRIGPGFAELLHDLLPVALLGVAQRAPPAIALCVSILAPTLLDLLPVLGVVEAVKHVFCHEL